MNQAMCSNHKFIGKAVKLGFVLNLTWLCCFCVKCCCFGMYCYVVTELLKKGREGGGGGGGGGYNRKREREKEK